VVWFKDDFEDGRMRRWQVGIDEPSPGASWKLEKDGDNRVMAGRGHIFATAAGVTGSEYRFKARVKLIQRGLHMNVRDRCTRYSVSFNANYISLTRTAPCGQHTELRQVQEAFGLNRWHVLEIVVMNDEVKVFVDDALKISFKDPTPVMYGGANFETLEGSYVQVDDVEVSGPSRTGSGLQIVDCYLPESGVGVAFRHQLTATGGKPPYRWSLEGDPAPSWMTFSEDGLMSGTPDKQGWHPITVKVIDSEGRSAFEGLGLNVERTMLASPPLLPPGEVGKEYRVKLEASNMGVGSQWIGLNLPPGLRLDPATGVLEGVPALGGAYTPLAVCMNATDAAVGQFGFYASEANPARLAFVTLPEELWDLRVGGRETSGEIAVTGGVPPYRWAVSAGDLPPLTRLLHGGAVNGYSPLSAAIGGPAIAAGRHSFTVEVTDSAGASVRQDFEIEASWIEVDADIDDDVIFSTMGQPLEIRLTASKAIGPVKWEEVNLPAGLAVSTDGKLSGTMRECGMLSSTIKVSDEDAPPSSLRFGAPVFAMCSAGNFALLDIHVPTRVVRAEAGKPFELRIGVGNGSGVGYELKLLEGELPPGLELNSGALPGAFVLSGTPSRAGMYEAFLSATDSAGTIGQRRLRISVE
jgi:hypothetical protein